MRTATAATRERSRPLPAARAAFCRTSLKAFGSNVPTLRSSAISCVLEIRLASGGGLKRTRLEVHCGAAVAALAIGLSEELPAGCDVGIGRTAQRRNGRADSVRDIGLDRVPGGHAVHLELIASGAGERREVLDVRFLGDAVRADDQAQAARDRADVELEIRFFVAFRRPVERALRLARWRRSGRNRCAAEWCASDRRGRSRPRCR